MVVQHMQVEVPMVAGLVLLLFSLLIVLSEDASRQPTPPASKGSPS